MRILRPFVAAFLVLAVLGCSKKSSKPTEPGDNSHPDIKSFQMFKDTVIAQTPCFVNVMFHVTDMAGVGISWLDEDFFEVREDNRALTRAGNAISVRQKDQMPYALKTILLLNNSAGADLDNIKSAAREFIRKMFAKQQAAVYSYTGSAVPVLDYTDDQTALSAAVDGIATGDAADNLYGVLEGLLAGLTDSYTTEFIEQNAVVLFTSGADNQGSKTVQDVLNARGRKGVLAVGVGSGIDANALGQIGNIGFVPVTDSAEAASKMTDAGKALSDWALSFYWLTYMTEQRLYQDHTVKVTIRSNENAGVNSSVEGSFRSSGFYTVSKGLFVNYNKETRTGSDSLYVLKGDTLALRALMTFATDAPEFTWRSSNENVIQVFADAWDFSKAYAVALGDSGESALITVTDIANNSSKTVSIRICTYYPGKVLWEMYTGTTGTAISGLTGLSSFPDNPAKRVIRSKFQGPVDTSDYYGSRIRAYIIAPASGNYNFWISSDDASEFWLSTDATPENKKRFCWVNAWTNSLEWNKEGNQKSAAVYLDGGNTYYAEALMIEGSGGDNLAVAWQGPGIPVVAVTSLKPIEGSYLGYNPAWVNP
jgi:hypothetical protein